MSHTNSTTSKRHFKHLSPFQRGQIELLLRQCLPKTQIAKFVGISRSTLYYELKRGTVLYQNSDLSTKHVYFADTGQLIYNQRKANCRKPYKFLQAQPFLSYLQTQILSKKLSPDAVRGYAAKHSLFSVILSTKTIYNYIDKGLLTVKNIDLPLRVRLKLKHRTSREHRRLFGKSIDERDQSVSCRSDFGHWEIDTIVGKRSSGPVLLSLDERLTRKRHLIKIPGKTASAVRDGLRSIIQSYGEPSKIFKSITSDNGSEFAKLTEDFSDITVYYAHPYSSFERGTNEKQNSLVRRFLPKGKRFDGISDAQIAHIEHWINHLPRKILDYDCADSVFHSFISSSMS